MKGPTHIAVGAATTGLVLWGAHAAGAPLDIGVVAAGLVVGTVGSLAPDIDHPRATISDRIPFGLLSVGLMLLLAPLGLRIALMVGKDFGGLLAELLKLTTPWTGVGALLAVTALALLTASRFASRSLGHRGPVHSLAALAGAVLISLIAVAALRLPWWHAIVFGLGWTMHLAADATTHDGLPSLLWPLSETGLPMASVVCRVILVVVVALALPAWLSVGQGLELPATSLAHPDGQSEPGTAQGVQGARQRLAEADPDVAAALVKPTSPSIGAQRGYTTYTWQYLRRDAANAVSVMHVMVALDSAGRMVGIDKY